jgi:hypothetical protein
LEIDMFSVAIVDQLRMSFGHVIQSYTSHARAAERLATLGLKVRVTILGLLVLAMGTSVLGLFQGHAFQVAAVVTIGVALTGYTAYVATNIETRLCGHRSLVHQLWLMCERYRSLLAEIQDGLLDDTAILERREALIQQLHAIYEPGLPVDQQAFESTRQPPARSEGGTIGEQQIDRFLSPSIRRGANVSATTTGAPTVAENVP